MMLLLFSDLISVTCVYIFEFSIHQRMQIQNQKKYTIAIRRKRERERKYKINNYSGKNSNWKICSGSTAINIKNECTISSSSSFCVHCLIFSACAFVLVERNYTIPFICHLLMMAKSNPPIYIICSEILFLSISLSHHRHRHHP